MMRSVGFWFIAFLAIARSPVAFRQNHRHLIPTESRRIASINRNPNVPFIPVIVRGKRRGIVSVMICVAVIKRRPIMHQKNVVVLVVAFESSRVRKDGEQE
jgi:hypothetical protein